MRAPTPLIMALLLASCAKASEEPPMAVNQPPEPASADEPAPKGGEAANAAHEDRYYGGAAPAGTPTAGPTTPVTEPPPPPDLPERPPVSKHAAPDPNAAVGLKTKNTDFEDLSQNGQQPVVVAAEARALELEKEGYKAHEATVESPAKVDALKDALDGGWREAGEGAAEDHRGRDEKPRGEVGGTAEEAKTDTDADGVEDERKAAKKEDTGADDGKSLARGAFTVRFQGEDPNLFVPPATTLPRMFYFENTYLGGSAAYAERLRRLDQALAGEARPYDIVAAEVQPFDPPRTEGLALTASIDATHFERARRVFLQVGLRGSSRYGWRRPPLDIVLVVDQPAFARGPGFVTSFIVELLRDLGPSDRLGIVLAGRGSPTFLDLARLNTAQQHLANRIDELTAPAPTGEEDLAAAMTRAGELLTAASDDEATVPGTKTLLVVSGEEDQNRIARAAHAAHELTVQGCVSSIFALDAERSEWWQVADAGYGNLHRITADSFDKAIEEEMQNLSRVVARLVRVNVRLGKDAKAIRVLGTRVLEQREVEEVKAREVATDINLSKSLGITADRGEDDDGIQTVIPYFYGDDSHIIMIELWVEGPGTVADVTLRYKDMVNLDNATARTSVRLGARPQAPTPEQILIARNVHGFELAEHLQKASDAIYRNDYGTAVQSLGTAGAMAIETNAFDAQAVQDLKSMVERGDWQSDATRRATLQETLLISGQRRVGDTKQRK